MDARQPADDGKALHVDVPGEVGRVGHDDVVLEQAVVGHVAIGHDQVVVADLRHADVGRGGSVDRHELPDRVVVADHDPCLLAAVLEVLGRRPDGGKLEDAVVFTYVRVALDDDVGPDDGPFSDSDAGTDHAERPHLHAFGDFRVRRYDCGRVYVHKPCSLLWVEVLFKLFDLFPELLDGLVHLRQSHDVGIEPQPLLMGNGRGTGHDARCGDVLVDAGPSRDHDVVADIDVPDEPCLAADDNALAEAGAARNAHLGHDDRVLTDDGVVGDLNEIVDLGPPLDPGLSQGAAVDRGVRLDLHVVVDLDDAHLGNFEVLGTGVGEPEPVASHDDARVEDHAAADEAAAVDRHVGIQDGILAHGGAGSEVDTGVQHGAPPDPGAPAHKCAGVNRCPLCHDGIGFNKGIGTDPLEVPLFGVEERKQPGERPVGVLHDDEVFPCPFDGGRHQDRRRGRRNDLLAVLRVGEKREIPLARLIEALDVADFDGSVPDDGCLKKRGDLGDRLPHGRHPCGFSALLLLGRRGGRLSGPLVQLLDDLLREIVLLVVVDNDGVVEVEDGVVVARLAHLFDDLENFGIRLVLSDCSRRHVVLRVLTRRW